jgi:acetyl esterase/lipase
MAATIAELYGVEAIAGDATSADPAARLAAQRAGLAALEQESPAGRDETIAGVPCRVFDAGAARGTYLHFHGGAMIMGSSRINDVVNAELAEELGVRVVSVDYRLAPSTRSPPESTIAGPLPAPSSTARTARSSSAASRPAATTRR